MTVNSIEGISCLYGSSAQGGDSQTPETRLSLTSHDGQQHRGSLHRHALQRHPQLQHPAGGEDRPDPHQHPEPLQPLGSSQGQLQPQHSYLREPGETTDSDGPPESQHPGSPHLTVTSSSHLLPIFIKIFIIISSSILSSLVAQLSCSCTK